MIKFIEAFGIVIYKIFLLPEIIIPAISIGIIIGVITYHIEKRTINKEGE